VSTRHVVEPLKQRVLAELGQPTAAPTQRLSLQNLTNGFYIARCSLGKNPTYLVSDDHNDNLFADVSGNPWGPTGAKSQVFYLQASSAATSTVKYLKFVTNNPTYGTKIVGLGSAKWNWNGTAWNWGSDPFGSGTAKNPILFTYDSVSGCYDISLLANATSTVYNSWFVYTTSPNSVIGNAYYYITTTALTKPNNYAWQVILAP